MRGKGKSWPAINQHSDFGFHELVTEDIPALAATVKRLGGGREQTWITHSLGGPLAAAAWRAPGAEPLGVRQLAHFAARRQIRATGLRRRLMVDLLWNRIGRLAVAFEGYLPATALGLGTAREAKRCFHDGINWSAREQWLDPEDGFDYGEALAPGAGCAACISPRPPTAPSAAPRTFATSCTSSGATTGACWCWDAPRATCTTTRTPAC